MGQFMGCAEAQNIGGYPYGDNKTYPLRKRQISVAKHISAPENNYKMNRDAK